MAQNCINNYYRCRLSFKAFRTSYKAFWMEYASPLIALQRTSMAQAQSHATKLALTKLFIYSNQSEDINQKSSN